VNNKKIRNLIKNIYKGSTQKHFDIGAVGNSGA
jgi:hypothetical protein